MWRQVGEVVGEEAYVCQGHAMTAKMKSYYCQRIQEQRVLAENQGSVTCSKQQINNK